MPSHKSDSLARGLERLSLSCFVCSPAFGLLHFLPQDACGLLLENTGERHQDVPGSAHWSLSPFGGCSCLAPGECRQEERSDEAAHSRPATTSPSGGC